MLFISAIQVTYGVDVVTAGGGGGGGGYESGRGSGVASRGDGGYVADIKMAFFYFEIMEQIDCKRLKKTDELKSRRKY